MSTPAPNDRSSVLELSTPTSIFLTTKHDRELDALQATEPENSSSLSIRHSETSLDRIANQIYNESYSAKPEQSYLRPLRAPESSTSSITGVDTPDDLGVDDNTDPNSYPSLLCVGLEVLCCILAIAKRDAKLK